MRERSVDEFVGLGIKLGVFIEYIPTVPGGDCSCTSELTGSLCPSKKLLEELYSKEDGSLVLTKEERTRLRARMLEYRDSKPFYLIHSPGDEEAFGGCVSAGRGFAHITPAGDLTPCPVSDVATHNLERSSMKEALASRLFARIREDGHLLESGDTPCALFAHPVELEALAREVGAYRTGEGTGARRGPPSRPSSPASR
jgi:MoaA/NifB/PqqE/SkfB family radical SAM enzyme